MLLTRSGCRDRLRYSPAIYFVREGFEGGRPQNSHDHTKTMDDLENMVKIDEIKKENAERKHDFEIVVVGMTPRDMEWQEESLDQILSETGGWKMKVSPERAQWMPSLLYQVRPQRFESFHRWDFR